MRYYNVDCWPVRHLTFLSRLYLRLGFFRWENGVGLGGGGGGGGKSRRQRDP